MYYLSFDTNSLHLVKRHHASNSHLEITYREHLIRTTTALAPLDGITFEGIVGVKYFDNMPLLLIVVQAEPVVALGTFKLKQIKKVKWIAISAQKDQAKILGPLSKQLENIQLLFEAGFHYFSHEYDLSIPFVLNQIRSPNYTERKYYNQFIWNLNLARFDGQKPEKETELFSPFCLRIIQGHINQYECQLPGEKTKYVLITRRSSQKAGTRFYARGINDQGFVANFAETEQIFFVGEYILTHLQIRGSVPTFFAQIGVNGLQDGLVIERNLPMSKQAFHLHFSQLRQIYHRILAINLLSEKKQQQARLTTFFQELISTQAEKTPYLKYQFYDFHQKCKNDKFENSEILLEQLQEVLEALNYTCYHLNTKKLIQQQKGVVRTNCLDCLDRTNYIQSRIARRVLKLFLTRYSNEQIHTLINEGNLLGLPLHQEYTLLKGFNELWADNGDAISLLYTGIGSTHTDITRTGQRNALGTLSHKWRSMLRFFEQFNDHIKHETIKKIVTATPPKEPTQSASDFHTSLVLSIDNSISIEDTLTKLHSYISRAKPTIVVIFVYRQKEDSFFSNLTCYIDVNSEFKIWEKSLCDELQNLSYVEVGTLQSRNSWMGVYCLEQSSKLLTDIRRQNLSEQQNYGQALLVKMKLQHSSFVFAGLNCSTLQNYLSLFDEVHEKGFRIRKLGKFQEQTAFKDLDYKIIVGNTNSKINMPASELRALTEQFQAQIHSQNERTTNIIIHHILDCDQFGLEETQKKNKYLRMYNQPPIHFIPGSNRMVFWNQENIILRVRQYQDIGSSSIVSVLDYEVGRTRKNSIMVPS